MSATVPSSRDPPSAQRGLDRSDVHALGAHCDAQRVAATSAGADRYDYALFFADAHDGVLADELVDREVERVQRADEVCDERCLGMLVDLARAADLLHLDLRS